MTPAQSSYTKHRLADLVDIQIGKTPSRSVRDYFGEGYTWLSIADMNGSDIVTSSKEEITERAIAETGIKLIPKGALLFSFKLSIGKVAFAGRDMYSNEAIAAFLIKDKRRVDPRYLYYVLREFDFTEGGDKAVKGITLNKRKLEELRIPLPDDLPTQRRIAAVLDKAQALVANDRQTLALYDQLAKSLFLEMFGDPVKNERGWEVVTMGQVMRTKTQNGLYVPKERYTEDGVQMVHMSDAFQGIVQPGRLKRVSISDADQAKYLLEPDDLLVARRSLNYEGSVKPCRIPSSTEPLVYESSLIRLRFNRAVVHPIFVHYYLNDDGARRHHVFKHVTSSTISGINNTGLNAIRMYLPPVHLQDRFNKLVKKIELDKVSTEASLRRSEGLFGSLLQGAFNGELGA